MRTREDPEPHHEHLPDDDGPPAPQPRSAAGDARGPARRHHESGEAEKEPPPAPRRPPEARDPTLERAEPIGGEHAPEASGEERRTPPPGQPEDRHDSDLRAEDRGGQDRPAIELSAPGQEGRVEHDEIRGPRGEEAFQDAAQEDDAVDRERGDAGVEDELREPVEHGRPSPRWLWSALARPRTEG